jgi:uncharacterized protein (DUF2235 family)
VSKNILIFSDGTGQAGGLQPDQRLSNVYKLFRATRTGPDSSIDPADQVAFYDAGLGTGNDEGTVPLRTWRFLRKFTSAAVGFGISRNIADCYEAILKHYEPGDRIFLFGFSRGAYTARCVGGVLNLCGIPTRTESEPSYPRYGKALREIADEAVGKVYEHGAGRDRAKFEPEREEQARRFRAKYGSEVDGKANVPPYFIGVFDTVAALGASGVKRFVMNLGILVVAILVSALVAGVTTFLGAEFSYAFWTTMVVGGLVAGYRLLRSSLKIIRDFPEPGQFRWHLARWKSGFYDRFLSTRVRYARHALAIDETRRDFARVEWGIKGAKAHREPGEPEWLVQLWFAGNHSDIGGSYAEDESRLSDIALGWMVEQVTSLPHPVIVDKTKLHLFPASGGMQHSEVASLRDKYPRWVPEPWRLSWKEKPRVEVLGAPLHPSVLERFTLAQVSQYGKSQPYRPETLAKDERVAQFYEN